MANEAILVALPDDGGAYVADRASALSGVPKSTLHYWARNGILVPSISDLKQKVWSYSDLLRLRIIYWLRQPKSQEDGLTIPPSTMTKVRSAIAQLEGLGLDLVDHSGGARVFVTLDGHVLLKDADGAILDGHRYGQIVLPEVLDLIGPFDLGLGIKGPDLKRPRSELRISPRKLSGAPHVVDTRLETAAIAALSTRGFTVEQVCELYPFASPIAINQAVDLEHQLRANIAA